jgi:hypothetical protein
VGRDGAAGEGACGDEEEGCGGDERGEHGSAEDGLDRWDGSVGIAL